MERDFCLDNLKGLGMLLVILGHCPNVPYVTEWLYTFHMPLFILASGCFFKPYPISKRFKSLIIPYLYFFLIYLCVGIFLNIFFVCITNKSTIDALNTFVYLYFDRLFPESRSFETSILFKTIWFLPMLFLIQVAYQILTRYHFKWIIPLLFGIGCYCSVKSIDLPFFIDTFCILIMYFYIGHVTYPKVLEFRNRIGIPYIMMLILLPLLIVILFDVNVDYKYNEVPLYNHFLSLSSVFGLYLFFYKLQLRSFLEIISKDSIIYFGFLRVIFLFLNPLLHFLRIPSFIYSFILCFFTVIILFFIVSKIINSKFLFLIGKTKSRQL